MPRAVRVPARQQAAGRRRPLPARAGPGLLHDRLGRARGQRRGRRRAARRPTRPCCTTGPAPSTWPRAGGTAARAQGLRDVLLGLAASVDEPIAGGRHKVFGHPGLAVIPQTSTIASHLPRAVGRRLRRRAGRPARRAGAVARRRDRRRQLRRRLGQPLHRAPAPSTRPAVRAYQGLPMPLLLVCEDNGLGISVRTPDGWVAAAPAARGCDISAPTAATRPACYDAALAAADHVRAHRAARPAAPARRAAHGSRGLATWRSATGARREIDGDLARDPLARRPRGCSSRPACSPPTRCCAGTRRLREHRSGCRRRGRRRPRLAAADEVAGAAGAAHARGRRPGRHRGAPARGRRSRAFGGRLPEEEGPLTLAQAINRTLADARPPTPSVLVFGEDVARKGGVYGVTRGLQRRFGAGRVFDTLLDEQAVLGLGARRRDLRPAAGARDPVPGVPAQRPGPAPGRGRDAAVLLQRRLPQPDGGARRGLRLPEGLRRPLPQRQLRRRAARHPGPGRRLPRPARRRAPRCCAPAWPRPASTAAVCVFLEPIALYNTRDLFEAGDDGWLSPYAAPERWAESTCRSAAPAATATAAT